MVYSEEMMFKWCSPFYHHNLIILRMKELIYNIWIVVGNVSKFLILFDFVLMWNWSVGYTPSSQFPKEYADALGKSLQCGDNIQSNFHSNSSSCHCLVGDTWNILIHGISYLGILCPLLQCMTICDALIFFDSHSLPSRRNDIRRICFLLCPW